MIEPRTVARSMGRTYARASRARDEYQYHALAYSARSRTRRAGVLHTHKPRSRTYLNENCTKRTALKRRFEWCRATRSRWRCQPPRRPSPLSS